MLMLHRQAGEPPDDALNRHLLVFLGIDFGAGLPVGIVLQVAQTERHLRLERTRRQLHEHAGGELLAAERLVSGVDADLVKKLNKTIKFPERVRSLGMLEFSNTVQAIEIADFIEDESPVEVLTIKIGIGMCNKGVVLFEGDTSAVKNTVVKVQNLKIKELIAATNINSPNEDFLSNFHL